MSQVVVFPGDFLSDMREARVASVLVKTPVSGWMLGWVTLRSVRAAPSQTLAYGENHGTSG